MPQPDAAYDLKLRLFLGVLMTALLMLILSAAYTLREQTQRIDRNMKALSRTLSQFQQIDPAYQIGEFQSQVPELNLSAFEGIANLQAFCLQVRNLSDMPVVAKCLGHAETAPEWVGHILQHVIGESSRQQLRLHRYPSVKVGELHLEPHWQAEAGQLWQTWQLILALTFGVLLIGTGVYAMVRRAIQPTRDMVDAMERMAQGHSHARMPDTSMRELRRMGIVFNHLADQLQNTIATQQELAHRLLQVREEERHHLSHELHDELGQSLAAMRVELVMAEEQAGHSARTLLPALGRMSAICATMFSSMQQLLHRLHPVGLDIFGLEACLRQLVQGWQQREATGCSYSLEMSGQWDDLDSTWRVSLYRLVQEGITNAAKHARASHVTVRLHRNADGIALDIADNGPTTTLPGLVPGAGRGLTGMLERTQALRGHMHMSLAQPCGLQLHMRWPEAVPPMKDLPCPES